MEIEFNASRVSQSEPSQSVPQRKAAPTASDVASFTSSASLKDQLNQIQTIRPEEVARAQSLVSNGKYPPDDILDRIAILLGLHIKGSQNSQ